MSVRDRWRINGEKGAMLATSLGGEAAGGDGVAANIGDGGAGEEATEASSVAGTGEGDGGGGIDAGTTSAAGAEANQACSEAGTGEGDGGAAGEDAGMTSAAGAEANEASSEAGTVEGDGSAAGEGALLDSQDEGGVGLEARLSPRRVTSLADLAMAFPSSLMKKGEAGETTLE